MHDESIACVESAQSRIKTLSFFDSLGLIGMLLQAKECWRPLKTLSNKILGDLVERGSSTKAWN